MSGCGRLRRFHQTRRRKSRCGRLSGLRFFQHGRGGLFAFHRRPFGKHVAAGQGDAALARETLDELARHDFLDGARGALQLDAVRAL